MSVLILLRFLCILFWISKHFQSSEIIADLLLLENIVQNVADIAGGEAVYTDKCTSLVHFISGMSSFTSNEIS